MRTTKGREESRVADAACPRLFRAKMVRPAPPGPPQRAGFGLGPPALFSAQAGENRAPGGATGPFFRRRREKPAWGGLLGGAAGDALSKLPGNLIFLFPEPDIAPTLSICPTPTQLHLHACGAQTVYRRGFIEL